MWSSCQALGDDIDIGLYVTVRGDRKTVKIVTRGEKSQNARWVGLWKRKTKGTLYILKIHLRSLSRSLLHLRPMLKRRRVSQRAKRSSRTRDRECILSFDLIEGPVKGKVF